MYIEMSETFQRYTKQISRISYVQYYSVLQSVNIKRPEIAFVTFLFLLMIKPRILSSDQNKLKWKGRVKKICGCNGN